MAHQSGITASAELQNFLSNCKDGRTRSFKVTITDETMHFSGKTETKSTFEDDFDDAVKPFLDDKVPSYIMVRMDHKNTENMYFWFLLAYSPDESLVRDKMKYASTRNSFKRVFGDYLIENEMFCTRKAEASFAGYKEFVRMKNAPKPMTDMENLVIELKASEEQYYSTESLGSNLPGVEVNVDENLQRGYEEFNSDKINFLQVSLDINRGLPRVLNKSNISVEEIASHIPSDEPCFIFYRFDHDFESQHYASKVFIYYVPGFKTSVKHRMIYSTSKSSITSVFEQKYSPLVKKLEVTDASDFTEEYLLYEIHPRKEESKKKFDKPKRPGRQ